LTLKGFFKQRLRLIDGALKKALPRARTQPGLVHAAMRYGVLSGGKRFRPILLLAVAEACGARAENALLPAVAVELVHAYSLIHDDLPCMDDDDLRRGKSSCHRKFGEANALLAGDALLTLSLETLSKVKHARTSQRLCGILTRAIGTAGMIGGQVVDKQYEGREINMPTLTYIHVHKTGQLIRACCEMGTVAARANAKTEGIMRRFGEYLGFAFQIVDDIIDVDGYVRLMSAMEAREKACELIDKAKRELAPLGNRTQRLREIADFVLRRKR